MPSTMRLLLVALVSVGAVVLSGCSKPPPPSLPPPVVTLSEFNKVTPGMTYQQVVDAVGAKEGAKGDLTDKVIYDWTNPDGSRMTVTIQGDRVVSKTQVDLKRSEERRVGKECRYR